MSNNKQRLGLYAGSFQPFHLGHLDIVKQSMQVFDEVLVAKGNNPEKSNHNIYPLPKKFLYNMGLHVTTFDGLLVDLIKQWEPSFDIILVRGLRSGADLDYEQNFAAFLREMYHQVKIVAFYCDPKLRHLSSSALRGIQKISEQPYN